MKVKICCIQTTEEANLVIQHGATAIGLVGHMPSGPGIISDEQIATIATSIPSHIESFLLTSETTVEDIVAHHKKTKTTCIQIVDRISLGTTIDLKNVLPDIKIIPVIHVLDEWTIEEAVNMAPYVDALLLDSGNPNLAIKQLGGTGKVHNWTISKRIVQAVDVPVYLAGGLNASNIAQAIDQVQPFGVDLCSGVQTNKKVDRQKLNAFFNAIKMVGVR